MQSLLINLAEKILRSVPWFPDEPGDRPRARRPDGQRQVRLGGLGDCLDGAEVPQQRARLGLAQAGNRQERRDDLKIYRSILTLIFDLTKDVVSLLLYSWCIKSLYQCSQSSLNDTFSHFPKFPELLS